MLEIGGIVMAVRQDVGLSWLMAVSVPVLLVIVSLIVVRMVPAFTKMQARIDRINQIMREQLTGIRVVRAFVREDEERTRFTAASADVMATGLRAGNLMALMFPAVMLVMNVSSVAVIWFGAEQVQNHGVQIGTLFAFLTQEARDRVENTLVEDLMNRNIDEYARRYYVDPLRNPAVPLEQIRARVVKRERFEELRRDQPDWYELGDGIHNLSGIDEDGTPFMYKLAVRKTPDEWFFLAYDMSETMRGATQFQRFMAMWVCTTLLSTWALTQIDDVLGLRWVWLAKPAIEVALGVVGFVLSRYWIYKR